MDIRDDITVNLKIRAAEHRYCEAVGLHVNESKYNGNYCADYINGQVGIAIGLFRESILSRNTIIGPDGRMLNGWLNARTICQHIARHFLMEVDTLLNDNGEPFGLEEFTNEVHTIYEEVTSDPKNFEHARHLVEDVMDCTV